MTAGYRAYMYIIVALHVHPMTTHTWYSLNNIKLSHKREWKMKKYDASAAHIQQGRRSSWMWDAGVLYFPVFHEPVCDTFIFKANLIIIKSN